MSQQDDNDIYENFLPDDLANDPSETPDWIMKQWQDSETRTENFRKEKDWLSWGAPETAPETPMEKFHRRGGDVHADRKKYEDFLSKTEKTSILKLLIFLIGICLLLSGLVALKVFLENYTISIVW